MAKRPLRKTNRTVLIVVEGYTDEAFTKHVKRLYYHRGMRLSVSIHNAFGHGPRGIIKKLKSVAQTADFNHRIAVFDADVPLTAEEASWLRKEKVDTIVSVPAIEAPLLAILGKPAPKSTEACKKELQKHAPGDPTEASYHEKYFPHDKLEQARGKFAVLDALIAAVSTE